MRKRFECFLFDLSRGKHPGLPGRKCIIDTVTLEDFPLFQGLENRDIDLVQQVATKKELKEKEVLISQGDLNQSVYIILSGIVRVYCLTASGDYINLAILGPGDIVGELSYLGNKPRSATAETLTQAAVLEISSSNLARLTKTIPRLSQNLTNLVAERIRLANANLETLTGASLGERVFKTLEMLAPQFAKREVTISHEQLAEIVGATRPRVTEVLDQLKKDSSISLSHRKIFVP